MAALTFPRDLPPGVSLFATEFRLGDDNLVSSTSRGGDTQDGEIAEPRWIATVAATLLKEGDAGALEAWLDTISQPPHPFWLWDLKRQYPIAYPGGISGLMVGGSPWDGTCTLDSVETDNVRANLSDLPPGAVLTPGDKSSWLYDSASRAALHRVVVGGTADGAGNLTVEVRPHIRGTLDDPTTVSLTQPKALFRYVRGSLQPSKDWDGRSSFSFQARQTLKAEL